jgi:hypothetical protein
MTQQPKISSFFKPVKSDSWDDDVTEIEPIKVILPVQKITLEPVIERLPVQTIKVAKQSTRKPYEAKMFSLAEPTKRKLPEGFHDIPNHSKPSESKVSSFQASNSSRKKRDDAGNYVELSKDQFEVKELVVNQRKSVFFTGRAGTGKCKLYSYTAFLLKEIIRHLSSLYSKDKYQVTASTGIAAYNIGGCTLHSFAGCGLGNGTSEELYRMASRNKKTLERWLSCNILIIDEGI